MKPEINEQELLRRMDALPREITPDHDVWPGILSKIGGVQQGGAELKRASHWRSLGLAAGILVAFATGLLLGPRWLAPPEGISGDQQSVATDTAVSRFPPNLSATLVATEMEYRAAFREFMAVGDSTDSLSPTTVNQLMLSWDEMKQSEAGLMLALQDNPYNPFLTTRMMQLRARQLDFLKEIAELDHNSKRTMI